MLIEGYFSSPTLNEIIYTFPPFLFSRNISFTSGWGHMFPLIHLKFCQMLHLLFFPVTIKKKNIFSHVKICAIKHIYCLFWALSFSIISINSNFYYNEFFILLLIAYIQGQPLI